MGLTLLWVRRACFLCLLSALCPGSGASPQFDCASALISGFPASGSGSDKFILFISPQSAGLCYGGPERLTQRHLRIIWDQNFLGVQVKTLSIDNADVLTSDLVVLTIAVMSDRLLKCQSSQTTNTQNVPAPVPVKLYS